MEIFSLSKQGVIKGLEKNLPVNWSWPEWLQELVLPGKTGSQQNSRLTKNLAKKETEVWYIHPHTHRAPNNKSSSPTEQTIFLLGML